MQVCYKGFYGLNHSWSVVSQNISRSLINLGHSLDVFSTNGIDKIPNDLIKNVIGYVENDSKLIGNTLKDNYDVSLSYTAMKNFPQYLQHSKKNRFGIWTFEFDGKNALPSGFAKNHIYCDKILPPSKFAKQVFSNSGIPENKMTVISHGINLNEIDSAEPYKLKTNKSTKILINLGQIHRRKNLSGALDMFGKAFSKKDDVCLILKIQDKTPQFNFELSFSYIYKEFISKYPNHAEVEIIRDFIPNIYSLYKSCDITFSPSNCEGFGMVPMEGMACGLFPIASNYGGWLDYLDDNNSLLINGNEFKVPSNYLYYEQKSGTIAFKPFEDDGIEKLKFAVGNVDKLKEKTISNINNIKEKYNWIEITKQILKLVK